MGSDLYDKILAQQGSLEKLIRRVPGFKGYYEKADRRAADRMLRDQLTTQIDAIIRRYGDLQRDVLDGGKGLKHMNRMREVKTRLQSYRDVVAAAAPKDSGMFASIKVTKETLDRIYSFDEAQFVYINDIKAAMEGLETAMNNEDDALLGDALNNLYDVVTEARDAFQLRDEEIFKMA